MSAARNILATAAAATVLGTGAVLAQPLAAHADPYTPGCVDRGEFYGIYRGERMLEVAQHVGTLGHEFYRYRTYRVTHMNRSYPICGSYNNYATVQFVRYGGPWAPWYVNWKDWN